MGDPQETSKGSFGGLKFRIFPTESLCRWKEDVGEETADDDACGQVEARPSFDTS